MVRKLGRISREGKERDIDGAAWRDAEMINKTQAVEQVETQERWPSSGMRARCG